MAFCMVTCRTLPCCTLNACMQLRRQHMSNLVFLLRHYAAMRDWQRLAGMVAVLMASDVSCAGRGKHAPCCLYNNVMEWHPVLSQAVLLYVSCLSKRLLPFLSCNLITCPPACPPYLMPLSILQRQENLCDLWMRRHPDSVARLAEALGAGTAQFAVCCRTKWGGTGPPYKD